MVEGLELAQGARFCLVQGANKIHLTYFKSTANGRLIFIDELRGKEKPLNQAQFKKARLDGTLRKVTAEVVRSPIDPDVFADEEADGLSNRRRAEITRKKKKYRTALTLRFYVIKHDETPGAKKSTKKLKTFIGRHYDEALGFGFGWRPSASEVRKALRNCGEPGNRPLEAFIGPDVKRWRKLASWHIAALDEMVDEYWRIREAGQKEVIDRFLAKIVTENAVRTTRAKSEQASDAKPVKIDLVAKVSRETARIYLNESETFENYERKYGLKMAQRRYRGRVPHRVATRPLERVQLDQTQIDTLINILDEDGNVVAQKRPWLVTIIDECTRMFLAALLSFERPSTYTLMAAIKQMLTPKRFLIEKYGLRNGATNAYGKAITVLVDNGLENVNLTFQAFVAAIGIDLEIAPRATPEAKPLVERAYDTLNKGVWHRASGAIPFKPHVMKQRRLNPQEQADWTLDVAQDIIWGYITNVYHLSVHSGIEMAPARKWSEGLVEYGRPVVVDMAVVNDLCCDVGRAKLTADGVNYKGMHFHDPDEVTRLMKSMLPFAAKRSQRRSAAQTGVLDVDVRKYPDDCSVIGIVDSRSGRIVKLHNSKPKFSGGLSWREAASIKADNDAANFAFLSDDELVILKDEFYERMRLRAPSAERVLDLARAASRQSVARVLSVDEGLVEATVTGFSRHDVPHTVAAFSKSETIPHHKMQVRGRRKRDSKTMTSLKNRPQENIENDNIYTDYSDTEVVLSAEDLMNYSVNDSVSYLAFLENDLD